MALLLAAASCGGENEECTTIQCAQSQQSISPSAQGGSSGLPVVFSVSGGVCTNANSGPQITMSGDTASSFPPADSGG